jgi:hypothetical protein
LKGEQTHPFLRERQHRRDYDFSYDERPLKQKLSKGSPVVQSLIGTLLRWSFAEPLSLISSPSL